MISCPMLIADPEHFAITPLIFPYHSQASIKFTSTCASLRIQNANFF